MSIFKEGFGVAKAAQEAERALLAAAALAAAARQPRVSAPRSNGHPYANSALKTYQVHTRIVRLTRLGGSVVQVQLEREARKQGRLQLEEKRGPLPGQVFGAIIAVKRARSQMCAHRQSQSRTRQPPGSLRYSRRLNGGRTGHLAIIRMRGRLGQRLVGRRVALRVQPRPVARLEEKENPKPRASEDTERAEELPRVLREAENATAGQVTGGSDQGASWAKPYS